MLLAMLPCLVAFCFANMPLGADEPAIDYQRHIKPLLAARLYRLPWCAQARSRAATRYWPVSKKGAESGPVIAPGDASAAP